MSRITINVISRISGDKNFFLDILYVTYLLREKHKLYINVKFIGKIYDYNIFSMLERFSILFGISDQVTFTKRSIPIKEIENSDNDYFLNFSIGNFVGYSGIESINNNFKTIFYNIDNSIKEVKYKNLISLDNICLKKVFFSIILDKEQFDKSLDKETNSLIQELTFDEITRTKLLQLVK
ncbi:hypothetical protein OBK25_01105 [Empedobacter falsenii]